MSNNGPVGWPTATADPWPPSPQNTHPQKFHGLPQGVDRNASETEALLATAVGWWDCSSGFKQGDRWLRNRGTGGEVLDLRLGSSTSANSNDPLFLEPEERGYVYLSGVASNYLSVPDEVALRTGDLDATVCVAADDWTPAASSVLLSKVSGAAGTLSWRWHLNTVGSMTVTTYRADGSTADTWANSYVMASPDGTAVWLRFTADADNGSGNRVITFYYSYDPPSTDAESVVWTLLNTNSADPATVINTNPGSGIEVGVRGATANPLAAKIYRAIIKSGINGTTVLDINCDAITSGAQESFVARTGQMVSINRATSGRKSVAMPSKVNGSRSCFLFGADDYLSTDPTLGRHGARRFVSLVDDDASPGGKCSDFTVIGVGRVFSGNSFPFLNQGSLVSTTALGTGVGGAFGIMLSGGSVVSVLYQRETAATQATSTGVSPGSLVCAAATYKRGVGREFRQAWINGNAGAVEQTVHGPAQAAWLEPLLVGWTANGAFGYDGEFTSLVFFRRVLTTREIQLITDYYTKTPYVPMPTDAERKSYLTAKLGTSDDAVLSILKDAVWHVDAQAFRAGSSHAENLGWGGPVLNARLGSTVAAASDDPLYLAPETSGYFYQPGVAGNHLSVPHVAGTQYGDVMDLRVDVAAEDFTPAGTYLFMAKGTSTTAGSSAWVFGVNSSNRVFATFSDGVSQAMINNAMSPIPTDNVRTRMRVTYVRDTGAGQYLLTAYSSTDLSMPLSTSTVWTEIASQTGASIGATADIAVDPVFGSNRPTSTGPTGKYYAASVSVNGSVLIDINCDALTDGRQTSFYATTGQLVSIARATAGRKSVVVPNTTNKKMDDAHLYLSGVAGNYASVPDEAALDILGDIDVRCLIAADDWTPGAGQTIMAKYGNSGARSWAFFFTTGGALQLIWSANGSTVAGNITASAALPITDGAPLWVRVTLDVDNGASGNDLKFWYSLASDGVNWTQIGTTTTTAGITSIFNSAQIVEVGSYVTGTTLPFVGRFYKAQVYNGIAGTKVLDIDFADADAAFVPGSASSFACTTGQTVTLNSTASSGMAVKDEKWGAGRSCWLFGTDDYMETPDSALLDFEGGESFTVVAVAREFGTVVNGGRYVSKYSTDPGWVLAGASATVRQMYLSGLATAQTTVTGRVAGVVYALVGVRDKSLSLANIFANGVQGTPVPDSSGSLANSGVMRVGRDSASGANYNDMEIEAVAVWRRALTPGEIATLNTYFNV